MVSLPVLDVNDFNERIIRGYEEGYGEKELPADLSVARSLVPAGTATLRDFSYIAPEIPEYIPENCTGCMDCVTECPDTAILGKVLAETELEAEAGRRSPTGRPRDVPRRSGRRPRSTTTAGKKKGGDGGHVPRSSSTRSKCKGCAECVTVCDDDALKMIAEDRRGDDRRPQEPPLLQEHRAVATSKYINDNLLIDMMLKEQTHIYVGGAGSCAGCGEGTALRMMCAATGAKYGDQWGIVAATGCNTVYTSTYPYNPYLVPWTNSLFENAPADAMGVRMRWDQMGWQDKPLWCIGGDGAMFDIGFQALSRLFASGHEHQGVRARHAGLLQHRRPGLDQQLHRPEHEDERARQGDRRQAGAAQGDRPDRHDAPADVRRADDLRPHQPLLQGGARRAGVRRPGDRRAATRPASPSTAWPTTWPASRPGWRSIRGRSRC